MAVILLTLNQREKTLRCLASFSGEERPAYRILVWDNGSEDETVDVIRRLFPSVLTHRHPHNLGVASGRNAAAILAQEEFCPEYLLFLDNDMTVATGFLEPLLEPFKENPRLAMTTGKIRDLVDPSRLYGAGGCHLKLWRGDTSHVGFGEVDRGQHDEPKSCLPSGGCMLIRTEVFFKLKGFDKLFDPYGPEDLDLGLRMFKAGYETLYVPQSVVFHDSLPGRTIDGGSYSKDYAAMRVRHWLLFLGRHGSWFEKLSFFLVGAPRQLAALAVREARRKNLFPALLGLIQGIMTFLKLPGRRHTDHLE